MSEFLNFDEWLQKRLAADAQEAATLLRLALAEADEDPEGLLRTLHYITVARGGVDDLQLSGAENLALLNAVGKHLNSALPLPKAA